MFKFNLNSVLGTELVHKTFGIISLLDDSFLVILSDGATELVVIHGWAVLSLTPKSGNVSRVFYLEDAF